jgi:hypothetical protein
MLKIISIVISLANPGNFAVFVSQAEFNALECPAKAEMQTAILKSAYEPRVPTGVAVRSECKSQAEVNAMLEEIAAANPDAKTGPGYPKSDRGI